ncbi:hypothetical protein MLD38_002644 [Melastoma candidum]|uniref:Uncharacterized protein n=1 Tax=Melastoma candidum TaxID=119954 RepID=A0ACB9RZ97_9MYRT|nr:hypothetical protein MLD38_002644 [Melastoma candidum]
MATNQQPQPSTSTSTSIIETVNGSHTFTISGYSLAKGMGPGKYIASDVFTVGGYDWAMYFYPDGKNAEDTMMYVSVFIALASDGTDVRALFELTLVDQSGKGKHKVHSHFDRALESGPYSLKYRGSMWGYKRFLRRTALETSDYIKDDKLIMHCTVGVVRNRVEGPKMYSIPLPPSDMGQGLKNLLGAQFFGLIGDRNIDEVVVEDVEPSIFKAMLQFIYTDDLPNIREITGSTSSHTSIIVVQHLLAAADRYNLDRLKILCEAKLCEEISPDTVATTLALAEQHHCHQLKAICLKYAADSINLGVVMQSDGYKNLENSCPSLLSELLNTFALVNEKFANVSIKKKRSSGADESDRGTGESVNSEGRRVRRRY